MSRHAFFRRIRDQLLTLIPGNKEEQCCDSLNQVGAISLNRLAVRAVRTPETDFPSNPMGKMYGTWHLIAE
jgi:hypothetical protein